jgi:hypothetical protein
MTYAGIDSIGGEVTRSELESRTLIHSRYMGQAFV